LLSFVLLCLIKNGADISAPQPCLLKLPAFIAAVLYVFPVFFPLFAPRKFPSAGYAGLYR
jgi:hypothetical protein